MLSRKEKIQKRINEVGYKNLTSFLKELSFLLENKNVSDSEVQKLKGNFSKMINGERAFKEKEILAIEKLLKTSLYNVLYEDSDKDFDPLSIRYVCFKDDISFVRQLDRPSETMESSKILFNFDEFDKSLQDYMIQYKSVNTFRYLLDKGYIRFSDGFNYLSLESGIVERIAYDKFLLAFIKEFNLESFEKCVVYHRILNNVIYEIEQEKSGFFEILLNNKNLILEMANKIYSYSALREQKASKDEESYKVFVNPILSHILNSKLELICDDEVFTSKLLDFIYETNEVIIKNLKESNVKVDSINNNGAIFCAKKNVGLLFAVRNNIDSNISDTIKQKVEKINNQLNTLLFNEKDLQGGFSGKKVRHIGNLLYKDHSNNDILFECLNFYKENNIKEIPQFIKTENNVDCFTYLEGQSKLFVYQNDENNIKQLCQLLSKLHKLAKTKLNGKVYVHGDLSPMNVLFNNNKLSGIIDWDSCYIGEDYEDFVYIFWTFANVGSYQRDNDNLFDILVKMFKWYEVDSNFKKDMPNKIRNVMLNRIPKNKDDKDYPKLYQWVMWSLTWIDLYEDKIKEVIDE